MSYLFYVLEPDAEPKASAKLPAHYSFELWRPARAQVVPKGVPIVPFGAWWTMHRLHLFKNQGYSLLLVKDGAKLIHRSGVFPGYFRFPFMSRFDLQIGDTWTHPAYRKQGLASFAIEKIIELLGDGQRRFWYLVEENNIASIRAIEKAGFKIAGRGVKSSRLGLKLLGSYHMQTS